MRASPGLGVPEISPQARAGSGFKKLCQRVNDLQAENQRLRAQLAASTLENLRLRREVPSTPPLSMATVVSIPALTEREAEVVQLIVRGNSTKQVAGRLGISFKTAVTHRSNAMRKLAVTETASLVRVAIRCGLVDW